MHIYIIFKYAQLRCVELLLLLLLTNNHNGMSSTKLQPNKIKKNNNISNNSFQEATSPLLADSFQVVIRNTTPSRSGTCTPHTRTVAGTFLYCHTLLINIRMQIAES